jgi:hypothetical protein
MNLRNSNCRNSKRPEFAGGGRLPHIGLAAAALIAACAGGPARIVAGEPQREVTQAGATVDGGRVSEAAVEHPLTAPLELARKSLKTLDSLKDYEARFSKREIVNGQMIAHVMLIKHRAEPFSVYLKFFEPHQGREVIYVEGQNDGKLLAHDGGIRGLAGTFALLPTSPMALSESRHPITSIGMKNLLGGVVRQWEAETKFGEIDVRYYNNAKLQDVECVVIETSHPRPRREFRCHLTRLYLDKNANLPVRVERFDFPAREGAKPPLIEEYTYTQIRPNIGLKDFDFDRRNTNYSF